ncbi:MAG TPA: glycosyltransferase family 39 protein [Flavilitoribacter sp.]|nr:glycosyltransferase family 39 protein [Flavilitoribacter sp.]HMQ89121.1 glycosyltransferase family 39 protein [Flavilitoribacter sp.]
MSIQEKRVFTLIPIIFFFFLACPEFLQKSMYNDGIWYAILSKNLSEGIGTFWNPKLTATIFPVFHEHPPLVFGIQSLFFKLLGPGIITERVYALTVFFLSAWLIVRIWINIFKTDPNAKKLYFIPLSLWLLNEVTFHYYPANMLEPTLSVFTLSAILCLYKASCSSEKNKNALLILLAGAFILAGLLCKGFPALFPLAFFGLHYLIYRKDSLGNSVLKTVFLTLPVIAGIFVLAAIPVSAQSLKDYFDTQVYASVTGIRTEYHHRDSRFYILGRLFEILSPAIIITCIPFFVKFRRSIQTIDTAAKKDSAFFILLGCAASFPLVISEKQAYYYLLPALPYFALGLGILFVRPIIYFLESWPSKNRSFKFFTYILMGLTAASVIFSLSKVGTVTKRDKEVFHDVEIIGKTIPSGQVIDSKSYTAHLVGYLYRLHKISIDTVGTPHRQYLIMEKNNMHQFPGFRKILLPTLKYDLYRQEAPLSR